MWAAKNARIAGKWCGVICDRHRHLRITVANLGGRGQVGLRRLNHPRSGLLVGSYPLKLITLQQVIDDIAALFPSPDAFTHESLVPPR
jgi:hypothetical protein